MESGNPPSTISNRLWHIVQVVYYMLRKSISKRKLMLDIHLLLQRSKLAGKSLGNLLISSHHHHHRHHHRSKTNPKEIEFSCSNTPFYAHYFHSMTKKKSSRRQRREEFSSFDVAEMAMAFQMMNAQDSEAESALSSALPTPSPMMVRQLRITDSPFPVNGNEVIDVGMIDEKAEKFIKRFYEQLLRQQLASECSTPDHGYCRRPLAGRS